MPVLECNTAIAPQLRLCQAERDSPNEFAGGMQRLKEGENKSCMAMTPRYWPTADYSTCPC